MPRGRKPGKTLYRSKWKMCPCGVGFTSARSDAVYHAPKCRQEAYRKRSEAVLANRPNETPDVAVVVKTGNELLGAIAKSIGLKVKKSKRAAVPKRNKKAKRPGRKSVILWLHSR